MPRLRAGLGAGSFWRTSNQDSQGSGFAMRWCRLSIVQAGTASISDHASGTDTGAPWRARTHHGVLLQHKGIRRRYSVMRDVPKRAIFEQCQMAEFGLAEPSRILQHGLEHWLQIAWRA